MLTACFGQAVSEFGKYERVEKANGSAVTVIELLDLARESAFNAIISDIDTDDVKTGFGDELMANNGGDGSDAPFFLVEVMPTFRGGDVNKFCEWVKRRTNYPQAAIDAKIQGTVFITFIVEKDGSVSNVAILKGVHPLLDNEAVKAISESPRWSPGLQRGQPVRVRYQIPLNFSL